MGRGTEYALRMAPACIHPQFQPKNVPNLASRRLGIPARYSYVNPITRIEKAELPERFSSLWPRGVPSLVKVCREVPTFEALLQRDTLQV